MIDVRTPARDDRAVSIAVTHVLTLGITTLLISGLLLGASNMLETQRERAGQAELESIGDRHAAEMVNAVDVGNTTDSDVTIRTKQPSTVLGGSYVVELTNSSHCFARHGYDGCITLETASGHDAQVPLSLPHDADVANGTVQGGQVVVEYSVGDNEVTIRGDDS